MTRDEEYAWLWWRARTIDHARRLGVEMDTEELAIHHDHGREPAEAARIAAEERGLPEKTERTCAHKEHP